MTSTRRQTMARATGAGLAAVCVWAAGSQGGDLTADSITVLDTAAFYGAVEVGELAAAPTNGLLLYYAFDTNAVPVPDDSGNGHEGTVVGAAYTNGRTGGGYAFDGVDDWLEAGTNVSLESDGLTVAAWVCLTSSAAAYPCVYAKTANEWQQGVLFQFTDTSRKVNLWLGALHQNWEAADTAVTPGTWAHVAASYDGDRVRYYFNGASDGSVEADNGTIPSTGGAGTAYVGRRSDGYYLAGLLDDLRLYGRALSDAEVRSVYLAGTNRPAACLAVAGEAAFERGIGHVAPLGGLSMGSYTNR